MDYKIKFSQTFIPYLIALILMVAGVVYLDQLSGSFTSEVETIKLQASEDEKQVFLWQPEYIEALPQTTFGKDQLFLSGLKSYENKEWAEAGEYWNKFLIKSPKAFQVWELLGRTYIKNKQFREAINAFSQSLAIKGNYFPALINMGNTYFSLLQFHKAESTYNKAAASNPQSEIVHLNLGLVFGRQQKWIMALGEFKRSSSIEESNLKEKSLYYEGLANLHLEDTISALNKFRVSQSLNPSYLPPKIEEVLLSKRLSLEGKKQKLINFTEGNKKELESFIYYKVAKHYKESGSPEDAQAFLIQALQANPEEHELKLLLGRHFLDLRKFDQAEMLFKQMVALEPLMPHPYFYLGELESFKNDHKKAVELYDKAISIAGNMFPEAHLGKGVSLENLNNLDGAIQSYKHALAINPAYPEAFFYLGEAYLKAGYLEQAIDVYKNSIELNPAFARAWNGLGKAYNLLEEKDAAIGAFLHATAYDPKLYNARMAVATLYMQENNYPAAIEQLNFVLKDHSNYLPALLQLGEAYEKFGKKNEALKVFENILIIAPDQFEAKVKLAGLYAALENTKKAETLYEELVKAIPFDHELRFKLALQYEKRAKYKAAVAQLEKALELEPDYQNAFRLLEELKSHAGGESTVAYKSK